MHSLRSIIFAAAFCAASLLFAAGEKPAEKPAENPAASTVESPDAKVAAMLKNVSNFKTLHTKFTQTKHLKAFKKPMVLTGELCLDRPGKRFAWHVHSPLQYSCIIADGKLTQWDADTDKTVSLPLSKYPMLDMLSDTMSAFASGDVKALGKDFTPAAEPNGTILLKPKSGRFAASLITSVELTLNDAKNQIVKVRAEEKSGDTTELTYDSTELDKPIPDKLWQARQK